MLAWREIVTKKYSNLPVIRDLHDLLVLWNNGEKAIMKERDSYYTGTLKDIPMRMTKGMTPNDRALPAYLL